MDFAVLKSGIIKSKNYCPNPIAVNGIPSYADGIANRKVIGTIAYNRWWEEQIHYIHNGYTTGGVWVPGRYYKFVNFDTIRGLAGDNIRAELHDFQLDYALFVEQAHAEHFNIFVPKARRKSVTTMNVGMVIDYGYRFQLNYKAGIIAGQKKFAEVFMEEWMYTDSKQYAEFRIKKASQGEDTIAGYKIPTQEGEPIDGGTRNSIYTRTVFHDPNVMKGKFLHDVVFEESGENENLVECYNATLDCLMRGNVQYGVAHIYGTGGNMNKGSKGFKKMFYSAKDFNARTLFIPSTVFYFPYYANATDHETGKNVEIIPNLQHLKPHERVGWSDEKKALEFIESEKARLLNKADLKEYFDYTQNNPTNVKEVFRKTATNNFPIIKLNDQGHEILSNEKRYGKFKLEYKKQQNGELIMPYEVLAIPADDKVPESECVLILHEGHPVKDYRFLDVAGIDSYDQDQSLTSSSLGSMVVVRGKHNIPNTPEWLPVALIRNRPDKKEKFYEQCMMLSIYYNLVGAVLVDIANALIVQFFKDSSCERFLSRTPKKFESPNSQTKNEYGIRLTSFTKPRMIGVLQTYYFSHVTKIWFAEMIDEALNYDEHENESDNDTVDAFGIALMRLLDQENVAVNDGELYANDPYAYPQWASDTQGNVIDVSSHAAENEKPLGVEEDYMSRFARSLLAEEDPNVQNKDDFYGL